LPVVHDVKDEEVIVYTVEEEELEGYEVKIEGNQKDGYTITNTEIIEQFPLEPAKTKVKVQKEWMGEKLDEVVIHLLADGVSVDTVVLSDDNDWRHTFSDLPVVHDVSDEEATVYTVVEEEVEGYQVSVDGNQKDGFVITNTEIIEQLPLEPSKRDVFVQKVWIDDEEDAVTIYLLANDEIVDEVVLSDNNNWEHTFTDLPTKYSIEDEDEIVYSVSELEVEGYHVLIEGDTDIGFYITNTKIKEEP